MSGAAFFQAWPPIPYTADVTALAAAPGVDGGLLALSALERSPLARVLLTGLPALGGFQAAYLGKLQLAETLLETNLAWHLRELF